MSLLTDVADTVVAELNAQAFSQQFTAARLWNPRRPLADLSTLRVDVVPSQPSVETEPADRDVYRNDVSIDVAVRKQVDIDDTDVMDGLANLIEEIREHFQGSTLADLPTAELRNTEMLAIADAAYQHEKRVFFAALTLTYRVHTDGS